MVYNAPMYVTKPKKPFIVLGLTSLVLAACLTVYRAHPLETPNERVHRLCAGCWLPAAELDDLIQMLTGWTDRERIMQTFRDQFDDAEQAELWMSCGEALVDAARATLR